MKIVKLSPLGRAVFVGDTHGDLEASKKIIRKYLVPKTRIIFLGDYVDRGEQSKENINFLLGQKNSHPKKVYLLRGNHEAYKEAPFHPADFWKSLNLLEKDQYNRIFEKFPLALSIGGIIAVHGALPQIDYLNEINSINPLDKNWNTLLWGDYAQNGNKDSFYGKRTIFDENHFKKAMEQLGKKVLIRSHQQDSPQKMFDNKCLTIFTSNAYENKRTIAIADFNKTKSINSIDDLVIEEI